MAKRTNEAAAPKQAGAGRKTGRPSVFEKRFLVEGHRLALLGLTDDEIAKVWGVGSTTLKRWKKERADFRTAIARAREAADADVAASLYERAKGYSHPEVVLHMHKGQIIKTRVTKHYPPDTNAAFLILHNRHPSRWRRQSDPANGNDDAPLPVKVSVQVVDARKRPDPDDGDATA